MFKFLFRNLKGYRWLVVIAILVTFLAVGCEIVAAYPLKWIPSKVSNGGNDPSCNYQFLNPILDKFDIPLFDPSLQLDKTQPPVQPGITQCPISPGDPNPQLIISHHSTNVSPLCRYYLKAMIILTKSIFIRYSFKFMDIG